MPHPPTQTVALTALSVALLGEPSRCRAQVLMLGIQPRQPIGLMTGTHGSATNSVSNGQSCSFTWTNPYAGANTYTSALSTFSYGNRKVVLTRTGSGNNAVVVITISNA